jgi:hypothetical protein
MLKGKMQGPQDLEAKANLEAFPQISNLGTNRKFLICDEITPRFPTHIL